MLLPSSNAVREGENRPFGFLKHDISSSLGVRIAGAPSQGPMARSRSNRGRMTGDVAMLEKGDTKLDLPLEKPIFTD